MRLSEKLLELQESFSFPPTSSQAFAAVVKIMSEITNNSYLRKGLGASGRETGNAVPSFSPAGPPLDGSAHERFYGSDICLIG